MHLETTRFGTLEIDESAILTFTQPIIGFQAYRRFVLLDQTDDGKVFWLQSTDTGDLAVVLMDPRSVRPDYDIGRRKGDLVELAADSVDDLDVYTLVVVTESPRQVRTNLKAPILIHRAQRLAKQTILDDNDYPVQFVLTPPQDSAQTPQEVSNARANP